LRLFIYGGKEKKFTSPPIRLFIRMTASIESPPPKGWVLNPLWEKLPVLERLKALALREHSHNEMDRYYTCPQHPEAWPEARGLPCDCGADAHNREVEAVWMAVLS
jgi:hypothetical protein